MSENNATSLIKEVLLTKGSIKQDVYSTIKQVFGWLGEVLEELAVELKDITQQDQRIELEFKKVSETEYHFICAGDYLVFQMHTNVFKFQPNHGVYKTSYVSQDELRAYCGMIYMYNFLSDSLRYNRLNDVGYLNGRIFVNQEYHYMVEGKRQLGFLYNNFSAAVLTKEELANIIKSAVLYSIDFDIAMCPEAYVIIRSGII